MQRSTAKRYTVQQLAELAGVSVRTLHHYDEIGLLSPSGRTAKNYRVYGEGELLRLQQILIGRELGLSLEDVGRSLDEPGFDLRAALVAQRIALAKEADRHARMRRAIDRAIARIDGEEGAMEKDQELFDGFDPHAHEAEARWGHTDAYKESARRAATYTKDDWSAMKAEQDAIYRDAFAAKERGLAPDHPEVAAIVERHRLSIDRWFYPCSLAMQKGLADLYESDPRFAANIDAYGPGLTPFLVAAIRARRG